MNKRELVSYLNEYLKISDFSDSSKNGLQVDNSKEEIKKIGYAVDATNYVFELAKEQKVDMLLCHHGIFWGHEETITGVHFNRIKTLIDSNISLYVAHLPLDAHEEVGNNIGLLKGFLNIFGLGEAKNYDIKPFNVGFGINLEKEIHISALQTNFAETLQLQKKLYNFGNKDFIKSICFCSGGGGFLVKDAFDEGYDVIVTGEAKHSNLTFAKDLGQSIMLAGHYETEKIGPKLLTNHLAKKFALETIFLDCKY